MLKRVYDSLDAVPEALREHYKEGDDGKYHLQVEGMVAKERVDEFRENNVALRQQTETLQGQLKAFGDVTPERVKELETLDRKVKDKELYDKDGIEAVVSERTAEMQRQHEAQVGNVKSELEKATEAAEAHRRRLHQHVISSNVSRAAMKAGVRKEAIADAQLLAQQNWTVNEQERPVMANEKGEVVYGKDGVSPLTVEEWFDKQREERPHWFEASSGGGSTGGGRTSAGSANPWQKASWNLTQQGQIYKADPDKARRLAAEAGRPLTS